MSGYRELDASFTKLLGLTSPPIAVAFCKSPPAGTRKFLGQVPSGCSFWKVAATAPEGKSAFFTTPSDHYNCPVGSYTHHIDLPAARAHELDDVLAFMAGVGYVSLDEVPKIPRWHE